MAYQIQFSEVWPHLHALFWGALLTLRLSAISILAGLAIGLTCAFLRAVYPRASRPVIEAYVQVIRNTPFLVQIFLVYFGLPTVGIKLGASEAGVLALALNTGAYLSEIFRAGVESIDRGQIEAGRSVGLHRIQVFFLVILQPALQVVYPAMTSQFVMVILTSSVLCVISAEEMTAVANDLSSRTFRTIEIYLVVGLIYLAMTLFFSAFFRWIQRLIFPSQRAIERAKR